MSAFLQDGTASADALAADRQLLNALGIPQELNRRMTRFGAFAVPLSTTSVVTGVPAMFAFAMVTGGPAALVWSWLICGPILLTVPYAMGEICSAYPASGALYFWSDKLASKHHRIWSWITAWLNGIGQIAGSAGAAYSMALFIGAFTAFKFGWAPTLHQTFAIFVGLLVLAGLVNSFAVRFVMWLNEISVWVHVLVVVAIVISLALVPAHHQSVSFVFTKLVNDTGQGHMAYALLLAPLTLLYTMTGLDAPGHMSEETEHATINAPLAMVRSALWTWLLGLALILALLFAIQSYDSEAASSFGVAPASIMVDALPNTGATVLIIGLLLGQGFCLFACVTATSRQFFGAGRDSIFPLSKYLHSTWRRFRSPLAATWYAVVLMVVLGMFTFWSYFFFLALTALAACALFAAYIIPVALRLKAGDRFTPGSFKLRRPKLVGGVAVGYVSVFGLAALLPATFPIARHTFNWAPVVLAATLVLVLVWFATRGRRTYTGTKQFTAEQIAEIEADAAL